MLFCTTNFQFVLPKRCVFRKISYDRTAYTQNCVSPEVIEYHLQAETIYNPSCLFVA